MVYSNSEKSTSRKKIRIPDLVAFKGKKPIVSLTCYDSTFARICEKTSLDFVLVGDSLGHVMQGGSSTIKVTIEDVAYHTRCVASAIHTPVLVADMPFCGAGLKDIDTYRNVEILMRAGAEAVKIEGATKEICQQISFLTRHGMPIMGHVGLTPQSVHALGGYKIQGKNDITKKRLLDEIAQLQDAGCFAIVFELITAETAQELTNSIQIPSIGIGSGVGCDGQILVLQDMLGMNTEFKPKFLKHFATLESEIIQAIELYSSEVKNKTYPME